MLPKQPMSSDEKRWRAEEDARVLKRSMEIQRDPNRNKEAHILIAKELKELTSLVKGIKKPTKNKKETKKKG